MNIIGLLVPKAISLLTILIPSYDSRYKILLLLLWVLKLIIDYDEAKPGHSGKVYKLTNKLESEIGEILVTVIKLIPVSVSLVIIICQRIWIPLITTSVAAVVCLASIVSNIVEFVTLKKEKKERKDSAKIAREAPAASDKMAILENKLMECGMRAGHEPPEISYCSISATNSLISIYKTEGQILYSEHNTLTKEELTGYCEPEFDNELSIALSDFLSLMTSRNIPLKMEREQWHETVLLPSSLIRANWSDSVVCDICSYYGNSDIYQFIEKETDNLVCRIITLARKYYVKAD